MATTSIPEKIPFIGVGCIVVRDGQLLLVRNHHGFWSTPGGHLDFGESPEDWAAHETMEEAGVSIADVQFVAITNDVLADAGKHFVTIWMGAEVDDLRANIGDATEIAEIGWFARRIAEPFASLLPEPA